MRRPGWAVIWPSNIDSTKSRGLGRKIRKEYAVKAPSLQDIVEAAKILGLSYEVNPSASMPSSWWEKTGYVVVERRSMRKLELLRLIAKQIAKLRAG